MEAPPGFSAAVLCSPRLSWHPLNAQRLSWRRNRIRRTTSSTSPQRVRAISLWLKPESWLCGLPAQTQGITVEISGASQWSLRLRSRAKMMTTTTSPCQSGLRETLTEHPAKNSLLSGRKAQLLSGRYCLHLSGKVVDSRCCRWQSER